MRRMSLLSLMLVPALLATGCKDEGGTHDGTPVQRPEVSTCGGFGALTKSPLDQPADYCGAERLLWAYSSATSTLNLGDYRAVLNCCGERTVDVVIQDGVYVVTETDAPEGVDGRCFCECVFDLTVEVDGVAAGDVALRLQRVTTDAVQTTPVLLWEGTLSVQDGTGMETIDSTPIAYPCDATSL
jgi:hypothetical protein